MSEYASLMQDFRPLSEQERAALPAMNGKQDRVVIVRCGEDWMLLSAEPPGEPQPQTHRLRARLERSGIQAQVRYSSRLQVEAYLRLYGEDAVSGGRGRVVRDVAAAQESDTYLDLRDLLEHAVARQASDIHLECRRGKGVRVRLRYCGGLCDYPPALAEDRGVAMAHYLFSLGRRGNRQWQAESSCDGVVDLELQPGTPPLQMRLSSLPEARGWDLMIRLFTGDEEPISLRQLGYTDEQLDQLHEAFYRPYGAVIFAGPTGSGKSTSMLAAVHELPDDRKIVSLEQPVERTLPGASHVTALSLGEMSQMAPALHRWDADVAVVGEIRDADSLGALSDFTTSGRLTVATLHTGSVAAVPQRLTELGLSPSLLGDASFLTAIVNQRLLPKLCESCRVPASQADLPDWWRRRYRTLLFSHADRLFFRCKEGCRACRAGVTSRVLAAEVRLLQEEDHDLLATGRLCEWRKHLLASQMRTLPQRGLELALCGQVDPLEALRLTGAELQSEALPGSALSDSVLSGSALSGSVLSGRRSMPVNAASAAGDVQSNVPVDVPNRVDRQVVEKWA